MRWLMVAITLHLGACGPEQNDTSVDGWCDADTRCPTPTTCTASGICAIEGLEEDSLAIQLSPPPRSPYLAEQWPLGTSSQLGEVSFTVPLTIGGVVKEQGNPLAASIPAQIILERPGLIPGTVLGSATKAIEGVDENFNAFNLRLLPNEMYRITIYPDDLTRPPQVEEKVFLEEEVDYLVSLPAKDGGFAYPRIIGSLSTKPSLDGQESTPISSAQIFAVSAQDSDDSNFNFISTQGSPDTKLGVFELRVSLTGRTYDVWAYTPVEPGTLGSTLPFTKLGQCEISGIYGEVVSLGDLQQDPVPRYPVMFRVESAETKTPVDQVIFRMKSQLGDSQYSGWNGLSGEAGPGTWKADVTGGTYDVEVIPPRSSGLARQTIEFTVSPEVPTTTIALDPMAEITGQIRGWGNVPIAGARILFIRAVEPKSPPIEARANENGSFSTQLSPDTYRTIVIPPEESPMPRWRANEFVVGESPVAAIWTSPYPQYIEGTVLHEDGEPLEGVTLDIFNAQTGVENVLLEDAKLGTTVSNASGEFFGVFPGSEGTLNILETEP